MPVFLEVRQEVEVELLRLCFSINRGYVSCKFHNTTGEVTNIRNNSSLYNSFSPQNPATD